MAKKAKSKSINHLRWIAGIAAVVILFIILFPAFTKKQNKASTSFPITSPTPEIDKTTGWKIYRNSNYGFTFQYPSSLLLFDCPNAFEPGNFGVYLTDEKKNDCNMHGKGKLLSISINNSTEEDYSKLLDHLKNQTVSYITVDGKTAKRITGNYEEVGDQGEVIPSHPIRSEDLVFVNIDNDKSLALTYQRISHAEKSDSKFFSYLQAKKDITPTFNQILSSFKIIDQKLNTFEGSDGYNPEVKFSLNYPSSCKQGKQDEHGLMPGASNIICGKIIKIIPGAGAHGMGDNPYAKINVTTSEIILGSNTWTRNIYESSTPTESTIVIYARNGLLMEVIYTYYGYTAEHQQFTEEIIKTLKFTQ